MQTNIILLNVLIATKSKDYIKINIDFNKTLE
jgi:hypothetical protein